MAISDSLRPSGSCSTLPLVQDTVFMDREREFESREQVLRQIGEWPVKVSHIEIGADVPPHKYMAPYAQFEAKAERRTPLPEDAGINQGYFLPGEDERSIKPNCGIVYAKLWCSSCHPDKKKFVGEKKHSCTNRLCPECYSHWLHRQSDEVSDRLYQFRREVGYSGRHVVLSPSEEDRFKPLKELRQKCYEYADRIGVIASVVVMHVWRFRSLDGQEIPWKFCSLNPSAQSNIDHVNSEFEKGAIKSPAPVESPIPCRRYYYPHFHLIAWGWLEDSKTFAQETGWIYKNIRDGIRTRKDFYRTVRYMLSHAGIKKSGMTYVYRGYLHYTKWDLASEWTEEVDELCKVCKTQLTLIFIKDDGSEGDHEPAVKIISRRLYGWKKGRPPNLWLKFQKPDIEEGLDFTGYDAEVYDVDYVDLDE